MDCKGLRSASMPLGGIQFCHTVQAAQGQCVPQVHNVSYLLQGHPLPQRGQLFLNLLTADGLAMLADVGRNCQRRCSTSGQPLLGQVLLHFWSAQGRGDHTLSPAQLKQNKFSLFWCTSNLQRLKRRAKNTHRLASGDREGFARRCLVRQ